MGISQSKRVAAVRPTSNQETNTLFEQEFTDTLNLQNELEAALYKIKVLEQRSKMGLDSILKSRVKALEKELQKSQWKQQELQQEFEYQKSLLKRQLYEKEVEFNLKLNEWTNASTNHHLEEIKQLKETIKTLQGQLKQKNQVIMELSLALEDV